MSHLRDEQTHQQIHEQWMQLALAEAIKGLGNTHPNPTVGAVIVRDGQVLGKVLRSLQAVITQKFKRLNKQAMCKGQRFMSP